MLREVRVTPTGRTVVAKQAETPEEAARLRAEAELLEGARHPGVVEVLSLDGDPGRPVLLTAFVDGPTLAAVGPLPVQEAAGVLTAVAATLADLHQLGVVHGGLTGDSVILGPDGAPVLCGFGHGGRVGQRPAHADEPYDCPMDVFDLGILARSLCPPVSSEARALRRLADDAAAARPDDRPTARGLAASIPATVAGARLPAPRAADRPRPADPEHGPGADPLDALRRGRAPSRAIGLAPRLLPGIVAAAVAVVVIVLAVGSFRSGDQAAAPAFDGEADLGERPQEAPLPAAPLPAPSTTVGGLPERPAGRGAPPDCPALPPGLAADVDGDGCADPLRYAAGVLESGVARWSVGQAGDLVATGDWSCTGLRTLALLRPSTGELFRFDRWPVSGADASTPSFARVTGGTALRAADLDQDGCHELVVEREGAPAEIVRPSRAQP